MRPMSKTHVPTRIPLMIKSVRICEPPFVPIRRSKESNHLAALWNFLAPQLNILRRNTCDILDR